MSSSSYPARRRLSDVAATSSSAITASAHLPVSPLEQLYRSVPWVLLVGIGVAGGWSPSQVQGLIVCLIPVVLFGAHRTRQG